MFCTKCGSELEPGAKYCDSCGTPIENNNYGQDIDWMKVLSYLWVIVKNVFSVVIVISIYDSIYDSFQIIAVSLLIIIYCDVRGFFMIYGITNSRFIVGLSEEFKKVRVLLKDNFDESEEEEITKLKMNNEKNMPKIYINAVGLIIILLIAITSLLGTL